MTYFILLTGALSFYGFEYGIIPVGLILYKVFDLRVSRKKSLAFKILLFYPVILLLISLVQEFIGKEYSTLLSLKAFIFLVSVYYGLTLFSITEKQFYIIIRIVLLANLLDFAGLMEPVKQLMARQTSVGYGRGASGIFTEPSYAALFGFCLLLIGEKKGLLNRSNALSVYLFIVTTFSTMMIFPLVYSFMRNSIIKKVLAILFLVIFFYQWMPNFRAVQVMQEILISGKLDDSSGARLGYILRDITVSTAHYWMPHGIGSYTGAVMAFPADVGVYNPYLPGSLFGFWLVEWGFVALLLALNFAKRIGMNRGILLLLVSTQMISMATVFFGITIGFLWRSE